MYNHDISYISRVLLDHSTFLLDLATTREGGVGGSQCYIQNNAISVTSYPRTECEMKKKRLLRQV